MISLERRVRKLEGASRVDPERLFMELSDMELSALLELLEAIGDLPAPQQGEARRLITMGLRKRRNGTPWYAAMQTAGAYLGAVTEARPRPEKQEASPAPTQEQPPQPAVWIDSTNGRRKTHGSL